MFIKKVLTNELMSLEPYEGFVPPVQYDSNNITDASWIGALSIFAKNRDTEVRFFESHFDGDMFTEENMLSFAPNENTLCVVQTSNVHELAIEDILFENIEQTLDISEYFKEKGINLRCVIDRKNKRSVVLTETDNTSDYHITGYFISRYIPWLFADQPLTEDERTIARRFIGKSKDDFISEINKVSESLFNIRDNRIKIVVGGYMKSSKESILRQKREEVVFLNTEIRSHMASIKNARAKIEKASMYTSGLKMINEDMSSLVDFILTSDGIDVVNVDGTTMTLSVMAPLSNFDEDIAELAISNEESYIYDCTSLGRYETEEILKRIFLDRTIGIELYAQYDVDFIHKTVEPRREEYMFGDVPPAGAMLNQHLSRYACLGGNMDVIMSFMDTSDYAGVMAALVAATSNINIEEDVTNDVFFRKLFSLENQGEVFHMDGKLFNLAGLINELKPELYTDVEDEIAE